MNKKIRKRLIDLNLTITGLSRAVGYSFAYTHRVLSGRDKSLKAKERIAAQLKMPIDELWPETKSAERILAENRRENKGGLL